MKSWQKKEVFWLLLLLGLSLFTIFPLLQPGFYPFHDEPQIANLYQMVRAIESGQLPPRWGPDFSFGYGYPLFNFYYPLPFYLGTGFFFLTRSLVWSLKLVFALSLPLSGLTMYFLLRKLFDQKAAFIGSVIYLFTPYRAVDLYVRGAVGELWAFVFMPFALGAFLNLIKKRSFRNIFLAGFSLAGLILSHNLTAMMFLPFALIFCLSQVLGQKDRLFSFLSAALGGLLGLALSAYYWLPALVEKRFIQSGTPFNPVDHFPFIKQLIIPSWGYGASLWGPKDGFSFQIGPINLLVVFGLIAILLLSKNEWKKERSAIYLLVGFFFLALFLMNIRSLPLWRLLPLASYVQFPWRLLLLTTFFSSVLSGFFVSRLKGRRQLGAVFLLVLASVLTSLSYFKPEKKLAVSDDDYLKRFFADRVSAGQSLTVSEQYYHYSEDYLPLTIWTKQRPEKLPKEKVEILEGEILEFSQLSPVSFWLRARNKAPTQLVVHQYFFPGWRARVNGQRAAVSPRSPHGDMTIALGAGESEVLVEFRESSLRRIANTITCLALLVVGVTVFWTGVVRKRLK